MDIEEAAGQLRAGKGKGREQADKGLKGAREEENLQALAAKSPRELSSLHG